MYRTLNFSSLYEKVLTASSFLCWRVLQVGLEQQKLTALTTRIQASQVRASLIVYQLLWNYIWLESCIGRHATYQSQLVHFWQAKVTALSGTKNATTLYSTAKYPHLSPDEIDFAPLFGGKVHGHQTDHPVATLSLNIGQQQVWEFPPTLIRV